MKSEKSRTKNVKSKAELVGESIVLDVSKRPSKSSRHNRLKKINKNANQQLAHGQKTKVK